MYKKRINLIDIVYTNIQNDASYIELLYGHLVVWNGKKYTLFKTISCASFYLIEKSLDEK